MSDLASQYFDTLNNRIPSVSKDVGGHYEILRLMAKQRLELIKPYILRHHGFCVSAGPFQGMNFLNRAADGCYIPKLLGCYEAELHPAWLKLRNLRRYQVIINIGAAEGYYAVGLARLFPEAIIYAYEANAQCHDMLRTLAQANAVGERVHCMGEFTAAEFGRFSGKAALLVCDVEGNEKALLDPSNSRELHFMDCVVETHTKPDKTIPDVLIRRFLPTHAIQKIVQDTPRSVRLPAFFYEMDQLDQFLALWECRSSPTPWLVMQAKSFPTISFEYG